MSDDIEGITNWEDVAEGLRKRGLDQGTKIEINEEDLRTALKKRVMGQDHVIDQLAKDLRIELAKKTRDKPVANLIFLGPTGTGKSELAAALADFLYKGQIFPIDCATLTHDENINELLGVPPGFVGSDRMGQLPLSIKMKPRQVILFDEIEKSHPSIITAFLSMMDKGRLKDRATGEVVKCHETIIIFTSNAEERALRELQEQATDRITLLAELRKHLANQKVFRPEVIGRLNTIYVFNQLSDLILGKIAALTMTKVAREFGLELARVHSELVIEAIVEGVKQKEFGARPLKDVVQGLLGEALLHAQSAGYKKIVVDVKETDTGRTLVVRPAP
jgi:ATP-dependent Clp protease ATP-binding subunit ClpC